MDYEIIVVNDGSTDRTLKAISPYQDYYKTQPPSLRIIKLKQNRGIGQAANEGIKASLGRYIVRVDSDDYIHERMLEIEYLYLSMNKDFDAVGCDYLEVDELENVIERKNFDKRPLACGIMFRRDRLIDIGLYDPEFELLEDEDLRIRFLEKYNIHRIPLPLYRYCRHDNEITKDLPRLQSYIDKLENKHPFLKTIPLG